MSLDQLTHEPKPQPGPVRPVTRCAELFEVAENAVLVRGSDAYTSVQDLQHSEPSRLLAQSNVYGCAGAKFDGVRDEIGGDLLDAEPIPAPLNRVGSGELEGALVEFGLRGVGVDHFVHHFGEIHVFPVELLVSGVQPRQIQQKRGPLQVTIDDLLDTLQPRNERGGALPARDLKRGRNLEQERVHRIAQLMRGDGEEFVAHPERLLELRYLLGRVWFATAGVTRLLVGTVSTFIQTRPPRLCTAYVCIIT